MKNIFNKFLNSKNNKSFFLNNPFGFTLIELLVVMTIISILSFFGLTVYRSVQAQSRDEIRKSNLNSIEQSLEFYRSRNGGNYPLSLTDPTFSGYLNPVPKDPLFGTQYIYSPSGGNSQYTLCSVQEINPTPQASLPSVCQGAGTCGSGNECGFSAGSP